MQESITASLTDRLLAELPRFFGGRQAAFRELFQNAYRAGARSIHVTLHGQELTFEDDGPGCADPALLLAAGTSGWDESNVVEPAGLGFYSLLSKDVASRVVVQSRGWKISLDPERVLAKKPVRVEPGQVHAGLRADLLLTSEPNYVESEIQQARGYYPVTVTYNGKPVPLNGWQPEGDVATTVGRVGLFRYHYARPNDKAIWEYREVDGHAFEHALERAAKGHKLYEALLRTFTLKWFVDPVCGVRPKRPDRNDLECSAALHAAARTILSTVGEHLTSTAREASASWPDTLRDLPAEPKWLTGSLGEHILKELGWLRAEYDPWGDAEFYWDEMDESFRNETSPVRVYTKRWIAVETESIAQSVNNAIHLGADLAYAIVRPDGSDVSIVRSRKPKNDEPGTAWVAQLLVVGEEALPFLLDEDHPTGPRLVLACDGDTAVEAVTGRPVDLPRLRQTRVRETLLSFLVWNAHHRRPDWETQQDGDDPYLDRNAVERTLVEQISRDYIGGERARARERLFRLETYLGRVGAAKAAATLLPRERPYAAASRKARTLLARIEKRLEADRRRAEKAARLPADE